MKQRIEDPVVERTPEKWTAEQEILAKEALRVLHREFGGYQWGVEFAANVGNQLGAMIIRLLDIPTDVCYVINPKDIDIDRMTIVRTAGGEFLEALGLPALHARKGADRVRGLKTTPAGLIVPDHAAVPDTNPGFDRIKRQYDILKYGF